MAPLDRQTCAFIEYLCSPTAGHLGIGAASEKDAATKGCRNGASRSAYPQPRLTPRARTPSHEILGSDPVVTKARPEPENG
jgi:hypothetical protein